MKNLLIGICVTTGLLWTNPLWASNRDGAETTLVPAVAVNGERTPTPPTAIVSDANSYAAREKAAPQVAQFQGGDGAGIYIGGSTLAVVLLIVLLVILL